jgi:hypothetical protein
VDRSVEKLQAALKADPKNSKAANDLVMAYLLEKDSPALALEAAQAHALDGEFAGNLELAARPLSQLDANACRRLLEWYRPLAAGADAWPKATALSRAKEYGLRFLELHVEADSRRVSADRDLEAVCKELMEVRNRFAGGWLDLLAMVRPDKDRRGYEGARWTLTEEGLLFQSAGGPGNVMVAPYEPPAEYDLFTSFTREQGQEPVYLLCTFGANKQFRVVLGAQNNTRGGLEPLIGPDAWYVSSRANPTVRAISLTNHRRYNLLAQVRAGGIRVLLDGEPAIELRTDGSLVANDNYVHKAGVMTKTGRTVFHCLYVKEVSGKGKVVAREGDKKAGS